MSTRELMRLVVLAAFNLVLFQGAWMIVLFPPITLLAGILNLTLYWTWVRRRRLSQALLCSMLVGLAMALAIAMKLMAARLSLLAPLPTSLRNWLPDSVYRLIPDPPFGLPRDYMVEFALLDLLGFGSMLVAGLLVAALQRFRASSRMGAAGRSS